jgi:hypothetical protein
MNQSAPGGDPKDMARGAIGGHHQPRFVKGEFTAIDSLGEGVPLPIARIEPADSRTVVESEINVTQWMAPPSETKMLLPLTSRPEEDLPVLWKE